MLEHGRTFIRYLEPISYYGSFQFSAHLESQKEMEFTGLLIKIERAIIILTLRTLLKEDLHREQEYRAQPIIEEV